MFNAEFPFKNIQLKPKKISPLTRLFRVFKNRRPRHRFKRKKILRFKRRRVPSFLRKRRKSPVAIRVKFNFFAKRLFRSRISPRPYYELDEGVESLISTEEGQMSETFRLTNRNNYEAGVQDLSTLSREYPATDNRRRFISDNYFKTLREFINKQKLRLVDMVVKHVNTEGDDTNTTLITNYTRFVHMRKSLTLDVVRFNTFGACAIRLEGPHHFPVYLQVESNLTQSQASRFPYKRSLLVRPLLKSQNQTPSIGTSIGFLFLKADTLYKSRVNKTRLNKHRYSFFYSMDLKRSILRSKRAFVSSMFDGGIETSSKAAFFNTRGSDANVSPNSPTLLALGSLQKSFTSRSLFTYERENDLVYKKEVALKRIKFKPGYSRI